MYSVDYFKCALFLLFIYQAAWSFQRFSKYNRNDAFAGQKCGINDTALQLDNVSSILKCALDCLNEYTCLSFFYQHETQQCYGCSTGYGVNNNPKVPTEDIVASAYYVSYRYMGCVDDYVRILDGNWTTTVDMTTELCVQNCMAEGLKYALTEAATWCLCGNVLKEHDQLPEDRCNMPCGGDPAQMCGNGWIGSLYTVGR